MSSNSVVPTDLCSVGMDLCAHLRHYVCNSVAIFTMAVKQMCIAVVPGVLRHFLLPKGWLHGDHRNLASAPTSTVDSGQAPMWADVCRSKKEQFSKGLLVISGITYTCN